MIRLENLLRYLNELTKLDQVVHSDEIDKVIKAVEKALDI